MLEKFIVGILVTIIGAIIIYVFKLKQLYVVIPRLFSVSHLSNNGRLVEIRLINHGKSTEEGVEISLDPSLSYEVVASTDATASLNSAIVSVPRIPPDDDYSVLLMVENGEFSTEKISRVSSKTSKGKVIQKLEDVPPNFGKLVLVITLLIMLIVVPFVSLEYYDEYKKAEVLTSLGYLSENGWSELESYARSDFREYYENGEFPIYQSEITRTGEYLTIPFRLINRAAAEIKVSAFINSPYSESDPKAWESSIIELETVEPMNTSDLSLRIYWPKNKKGSCIVRFSIQTADDFIWILKTVKVDI